jgi:CarboxypepD_reg-like domain
LNRCFYYIICLLLFSLVSFSQTTITGKVISEDTNLPIASASIYFNNTSFGTASNELGEFSLALPNLANLELIVSSVGFEIIVYKIQPNEISNHFYTFKLKKKESLLQGILILSDATRRKYLQLFKDNFLGITEEAASSSITNLDAVYFTKPIDEKNGFNAYTDTPLIIINKRLGYKISFQLQEFYYNEKNGSTFFYGFTRYEELGDKKKWIKNRRKVYYGSTLHFFRSLISNTLQKEAYSVFSIKEDSLKQADGTIKKIEMAIPVTAAQLIQKDSTNKDNYILSSKNKIMVQYNRQPASKEYLQRRIFINGNLHMGFRSYLVLSNSVVEIDRNGILINPLSVLFNGYWIYEKAANLLPYNYTPEAENNND